MTLIYSVLAVTILAVLPAPTLECATNGLCGYGCPGYQPPPATSCGCAQRGYSCGSYGCYRARVRGAKSYTPIRSRARAHGSSQSSIENDREVLRERIIGFSDPAEREMLIKEKTRRGERLTNEEQIQMLAPSISENKKRREGVDPNRAFFECCLDRQLPDACLNKCNFGTFNKQSLTAMYFKQDPCPLEAMKEMQFCAAQGRDHTECCARNGVTTTLAGPKCLMFCDQRIGRESRLDMSFVPCFDRFESMKSCFWHDLTRYYKV